MENVYDFVVWENRYSVGVPILDSQHRKLIIITNTLYSACKFNDDAARFQFKNTAQESLDYIKYHFSTEEQIMEKLSYPDFFLHKKEHADFTLEVMRNIQSFEEGKKFVPNLFVRFLRDWILTHIAQTDLKLGEFLINFRNEAILEKLTMKKTDKSDDTDKERKMILAIDDVKVQLVIIKQLLPQYDVYTCQSPVQALEMIKYMDIDIVLLDLAMEEMSGFEFLMHLKKEPRLAKIPVIIVSGNSTKQYIATSIKMGAKDFVSKPINPDYLRKKIEKLLGASPGYP